MDNIILIIGVVLAAPFLFLLGRYLTRLAFSFIPVTIKVILKAKSGKKYSRTVSVSKTDELLCNLDEVISRAEARKRGFQSE